VTKKWRACCSVPVLRQVGGLGRRICHQRGPPVRGPGTRTCELRPKVSISLIGREAFLSDDVLDEVAERAACDVANFNQEDASAADTSSWRDY